MHHAVKYHWNQLLIALRHAWQNGSIFFMLAGLVLLPVWFYPHIQLKSTVQDTLFVIDISESMNVRDVDYPSPQTSRIELAKLSVRDAMASLPCGSRVSIGLFAGDEVTVLFEPLEVCQHFPAIEQVISKINTNMRWVGDSWIIRALISSIKEAHKRKLNLVMVTDADEMPHRSAPRLTELLELKEKVNGLLLGVGNEAPQPIPKLDGNHQIIAYWTREEAVLEGNHPNLLAYVKALTPGEAIPEGLLDEVGEHLSAFNQPLMFSVAQSAAMQAAHIKTPNDAIKSLNINDFKKEAIAERDARWLFGLTSAILILIGWFWEPISILLKTKHS
ncbi:VWA domain-containing protein [Methylotenera sp.]|uniref:VWA domain-containing protein n=1 Tax=Methylotenera sp. TaxID=2051956 RepID=UPI002734F23D|nr:VWA domain-containing protein [Methylotenera sp.]MDP3211427.1 VWA domain-containing protein [Methylotenera sp.]